VDFFIALFAAFEWGFTACSVATRWHHQSRQEFDSTTLTCGLVAYFSPSWTAFQADRGRDFSVIVDGISN
jgi:hypothetical protein